MKYKGCEIFKKPCLRVKADSRWTVSSGIAANGYVRCYRWGATLPSGRKIVGSPSLRALKDSIDFEIECVVNP